jgi:hypothetical protein
LVLRRRLRWRFLFGTAGLPMTVKIEIDPKLIADAKRLYETTDTPTSVIAATLGISRATLNDRMPEWGWTRRRYSKTQAVAAAAPIGDVQPLQQVEPMPAETPLPFAERLQRVIEAQMQVAERTLKVLGPASSAEAERTARILATVSRTVQDITATAKGQLPADDADDDPVPRDIDEFREALARRIEAFVAAERASTDGKVSDDPTQGALE